jgi:FtsP/CotA-like multicopper oxidase with cupredoxin domain
VTYLLGIAALVALAQQSSARRPAETVVPNDNRVAAGYRREGVHELRLEAKLATWRPDQNVDSVATVQVFAEMGGAPQIPGPLLRVPSGTDVRVTIRNSLPDSTLVVHGLRAGVFSDDTIQVPPGATRELRFRAGAPGTYLYWGTSTKSLIGFRPWRDSQLTGAIVIDPPGVRPNPAERIFVMTVLDLFPDDTVHNKKKEDVWELAINGRSWPHNERVEYAVGDTVRWRWLNGSYLPHPMHLHGFHFRVTAKGENNNDTTYATGDVRTANTEFMVSGSTFRMEWVPTRAGTWLMHCHMIPHITPFPNRPDSVRAHDVHDVRQHPTSAMAGLVLGITTTDHRTAERPPTAVTRLRLFAQQAPADSGKPVPRGYVLQRGAEPRPDSVEIPGSPIVLTRGETAAITVINRLRAATTVHWHGMELESVFDGVSGWSRTGSNVAPLLAPGDSFTVAFTPPRAGTFIYHTHMDEGPQLGTGMYAPLLVLEPGERFDPATDLVFMVGGAIDGDRTTNTINGRREAPPRELRVGRRYRLRFVNIHSAGAASVDLVADSLPLTWRPVSKDGADLPDRLRRDQPSRLRRFGVGETYDFEWTPSRPVDAMLEVRLEGTVLRQPLVVRP